MLRFLFFVTVVAAILSFADAIWNGETPEPNQYPSTVGLMLTYAVHKKFYFDVCGGALISNNLVITTATCLNFHPVHNNKGGIRTITLFLGGHNFFSDNYKFKYKFPVNENDVILHPKYNKMKNMEFDIALIRLRVPIEESDMVKIISLPSPENLDLPVGQHIIITGWGRLGNNQRMAEVLKVLNTTVVPKEDCSKSDESVTEDNICVYTPHKSICFGDSGSPNYIRTKGELILVGLSQRLLATDTEASCERNVPHLSISIIPHLSWINTEINK